MKRTILSLMAAAALTASAQQTKEVMVVTLSDGTTAEYNVADVTKVSFDTRTTVLSVTPAGGDAVECDKLAGLWRLDPSEAGKPTIFAFGTVADAASPADLVVDGQYAFILALAPSKLYLGSEMDLSATTDSYSFSTLTYQDGYVATELTDVVSGSLLTARNIKNGRVTIKLDATYEDGTAVMLAYEGIPTVTTDLDVMTPIKPMGNEMFIYNANGSQFGHLDTTGCTKSYSSWSKKTTYTVAFSGTLLTTDCAKIVVTEDWLAANNGKEVLLAETAGVDITVGTVQLSAVSADDPSAEYKPVPDNGTLRLTDDGSGNVSICFDVVNSYIMSGNAGGTKERVVLNYSGTCE